MVDPDPNELAALKSCKPMLAEILTEIGWEKRPVDWTEQEVMTIIEVVITAWEATKVPA